MAEQGCAALGGHSMVLQSTGHSQELSLPSNSFVWLIALTAFVNMIKLTDFLKARRTNVISQVLAKINSNKQGKIYCICIYSFLQAQQHPWKEAISLTVSMNIVWKRDKFSDVSVSLIKDTKP